MLAPYTFFLTRFDRRVTVSAPDQRGRREILAVHAWSMCLPSSEAGRLPRPARHAHWHTLSSSGTLDEDDA